MKKTNDSASMVSICISEIVKKKKKIAVQYRETPKNLNGHLVNTWYTCTSYISIITDTITCNSNVVIF